MKKNMGTTDRVIRMLIGLTLVVLYLAGVLTGTLGIVLLCVGAIFVITSFISFCPLYAIIGLSSRKEKTPPPPTKQQP